MWKWALACIQVDSLINIKSETNKQKELFTQLILNDDYFFLTLTLFCALKNIMHNYFVLSSLKYSGLWHFMSMENYNSHQ